MFDFLYLILLLIPITLYVVISTLVNGGER